MSGPFQSYPTVAKMDAMRSLARESRALAEEALRLAEAIHANVIGGAELSAVLGEFVRGGQTVQGDERALAALDLLPTMRAKAAEQADEIRRARARLDTIQKV